MYLSPPLYFRGQKKALQMDLESPLTHCECFGILQQLSAPLGPQVVSGQAPRPAKVLCLAFFYFFIDKLPNIAGL